MKTVRISVFVSVILFAAITASAARAADDLRLDFTADGAAAVTVGGRPHFSLVAVSLQTFEPSVSMQFGFFKRSKKELAKENLVMTGSEGRIELATSQGVAAGEIRLERTVAGNARLVVEIAEGIPVSAVELIFSGEQDDRYWGFGEQYNFIDMKGRAVPIWVQEQGVGRFEKPTMPYHGKLTDSYFPIPYMIDPAKGRGLLIENTGYIEFNFGGKPGAWKVEVWDDRKVSILMFGGPRPADVVRQLTAETGRAKAAPPDWALGGVWISAQGGMSEVSRRVEAALEAGVPVSAVWSQDWVGRRHFGAGNYGVNYRWFHDEEHYPGLKEKIADFNSKGVRFLAYFNPFVIEENKHFQEMADKGYLVKNAAGEPYVFQIITFKGGLIDVTNPGAAEYFKGYAKAATDMGISGWMADFGEWLPYDARLHDGDARLFHNLYATQWHRINREALEEAYPDGDFVMLTRSGYTYERPVAQVVWAGDQEADWHDGDGFPTVVTAGLTASLSGIPFFSHDIAGFSGGPSEKELFMRWTELGAFTPVMRTHCGLQKLKNHRFDSDEETLAHFKKFALIHRALLPYMKRLSETALKTGLPLINHTVLIDPEWEKSLEAHSQWMLGPDVLIAPVTAQGASSVEVHLPFGKWERLSSGEVFEGRSSIEVSAPIGDPAVFVRAGAMPEVVAEIKDILSR
jgi:alpha-glucosidase